MKKGDVVMIYEDPVTCKVLEGKAKLVKDISYTYRTGFERWEVNFVNDPEGAVVERMINVNNK